MATFSCLIVKMVMRNLLRSILWLGIVFWPLSSSWAADLPIADVHMHAYERTASEADWFADKMDSLGVKWGGGVGNYSDEMIAKLGSRYIPSFGQSEFMAAFKKGGGAALQDPNNKFIKAKLTKSVALFEVGKIKGFGEIHTDNHSSGPMPIRRQIPLISPVVQEIYKIADKYQGFVQLHVEYSEGLADDVIALSKRFPSTKTILAHCVPGKTPNVLPQLHKIFSQTDNVFCETSGTNGPTHAGKIPVYSRIYGVGNGRMFGRDGVKQNWKGLIERFPDRIMVGTDPCCGLKPKYSELIEEIRRDFLPTFSPDIAKKLAYENAAKVFGLE
jgi:hypothetical protein